MFVPHPSRKGASQGCFVLLNRPLIWAVTRYLLLITISSTQDIYLIVFAMNALIVAHILPQTPERLFPGYEQNSEIDLC
jgi:hypothetical protein